MDAPNKIKGFTFVELVITLTIIGAMISMDLPKSNTKSFSSCDDHEVSNTRAIAIPGVGHISQMAMELPYLVSNSTVHHANAHTDLLIGLQAM